MFPRYRNRKNQQVYLRLAEVVDCTNSRDGLVSDLYCREDAREPLFVRERAEFADKFEALEPQSPGPAVVRAPSPGRVREIADMMCDFGMYTQAAEIERLSQEVARLKQCLLLNVPAADLRPVESGFAVTHPLFPQEETACEAAYRRAHALDPEAAARLKPALRPMLEAAIHAAIAAGLPLLGVRGQEPVARDSASDLQD